MSLHKDWTDAKKAAERKFAAGLTKGQNASHVTGGLDYPLDVAFNLKLGNDLEKYEDKKNTSQSKATLKQKIHATIETYKTRVSNHKKNLGGKADEIVRDLTGTLNTIKSKVT